MDGLGVRCIDCVKRKKCRLRINRFEKKPCQYYVSDIDKASKRNRRLADAQARK